ncbi:MAG TPA: hypothetical protein VFJ06_04260 [Halococcus sp.]|nr:hypothetical protein [Halococcus sp.]
MPNPSWNIGDVVRDREDDDPDPAVVINVPDVPADEWDIPRFGKTLAEDNPDYPADAPIVTVLFEDNLDYHFPDWERDEPISYDTLDEWGLQYYTFPAPRLEPAEPTEPIQPDAESDGDTSSTDEAISPPTAEKDETDASAPSEADAETATQDSPTQPSAAVRALEARLEDGGMTTELESDGRTIRATKLGNTYRVRPDRVLDGDGPLRNRLEKIVDTDDLQATN